MIHHSKWEPIIPTIADNSIDVICIDPPYLYLKKQKLEQPFDEQLFFSECKRILTDKGFIVMFGRGISFYRWNTIIADLGFEFKEEIVWDKTYNSSPVTPINRVHETVVIFAKGSAATNASRIPYTEIKTDFNSIAQDIKRIKSALGNSAELADLLKYVETGALDFLPQNRTLGNNTTVQTAMQQQSRGVKTMQAITKGMKEKSIIKINRDHYSSIHPTQKPVRLIERLLALVLPNKPRSEIVVADFFAGSMSTVEACINMGVGYIATEMDEEYFTAGKNRIDNILNTKKELLFV